jgi:PKD repeat protein
LALSNKATVFITVSGVKADASAGSPYFGLVGEEITLSGELSYDPDPDGYIVTWSWDFGDGSTGFGEIVTHTYLSTGIFNVTLAVTDNEGFEDEDIVEVIIVIANYPPTEPIVNGPIVGIKNETYNFTFLSYDLDNDNISYLIDWDDGTTIETIFLPNGTLSNHSHSWMNNGVYRISVRATDGKVISKIAEHLIAIDVIEINKLLGFLVDEDNDGIIDYYEDKKTGFTSDLEYENGYYLINSDFDDIWDHAYNKSSGLITYYKFVYDKYFILYEDEMKAPGFEFIFLLMGIALVFIINRRKKR